MSGLAIRAVVLVALLAGCTKSPADTDAERLESKLARIETQCGIKYGTLKLGSDNQVTITPSADEKYEAVDCLLRELKKPEFADIKLGFVGNEAYAAEEQK